MACQKKRAAYHEDRSEKCLVTTPPPELSLSTHQRPPSPPKLISPARLHRAGKHASDWEGNSSLVPSS